MKILHTSDWHIGRKFHGADLLQVQRDHLAHLANTVRECGVDTVVVSGDIYDRALPSVDAVDVLDDGIDELLATGARLIMTAGNHDSAARLGFGRRRSRRSGCYIASSWSDALDPVDLGQGVWCYPVCYLEPRLVAAELACEPTHESVLQEVTDRIRLDATTREARATIVLAHAFVAGGQPSDSERDISVGGVETCSLAPFEGFTYTALGHLHGRATLTESVRYSGSGLAFSFSEASHTKGSWVVDINPDAAPKESALGDVEFVVAPVPRRLERLRGTLDELLATDPDDSRRDAWCDVTLTDDARPARAMERVRAVFPHAVVLRHEPRNPREEALTYSEHVRGVSDRQLVERFAVHVRGRELTESEGALVDAGLEELRVQEAAR